GELPSTYQKVGEAAAVEEHLSASKRQFINAVEVEDVGNIEIGALVIQLPMINIQIGFEECLACANGICKILRKGVIRLEIQSIDKTATHLDLERVVIKVRIVAHRVDRSRGRFSNETDEWHRRRIYRRRMIVQVQGTIYVCQRQVGRCAVSQIICKRS